MPNNTIDLDNVKNTIEDATTKAKTIIDSTDKVMDKAAVELEDITSTTKSTKKTSKDSDKNTKDNGTLSTGSGGPMITDPKTVKMFDSLNFWAKFMSVLTYFSLLVVGIMCLILVVMSMFALAFAPVLVIIGDIILIALCVYTFWFARKLWMIGSSSEKTKLSSSQDDYNQNSLLAFQNVQQFAKINGIVTIVSIIASMLLPFILIGGIIASFAQYCASNKDSDACNTSFDSKIRDNSYNSDKAMDWDWDGDSMMNKDTMIKTPEGNVNINTDSDGGINLNISPSTPEVNPDSPAVTLPQKIN
jgi:hypothetical protein